MKANLNSLNKANRISARFPLNNLIRTTCENGADNKIGCNYFIKGKLISSR